MDSYFDLGTYRRVVTAANDEAQSWFNRGLIWCYAFAMEEAVRCFERAAQADPNCAMAHWGIAYASGPYYNKPWARFDKADIARTVERTFDASQRALMLKDDASPVERALITALATRYQSAEPPDDFGIWNDAYADAMREVHKDFTDDADVCTLFADALMNRTPWKLWNLRTGDPNAGADTLEALSVVENKIAAMDQVGDAPHPGLMHLHIHLLEMSRFPERALRSADRLRSLVPDASHLNHMPSHIDAQCGDYGTAIRSSDAAIAADEKLVARAGLLNFQALQRAHNFHFKLFAAMLGGQYSAALDASHGLVATIPEDLLRWDSPPMADWLEGYVAMAVHPLIRFGRWEDILAQPFPEDEELYSSTVALLRYARTLAYAVLGDVAAAETEFELFQESESRVPATRTVFNNSVRDLLKVASQMATGEVAYRKAQYDVAFDHLRKAVDLADNLPYDEPWGWMQPPRHALGALLLEQDHVDEAEAVYRADLGLDPTVMRCIHHPENVWSLHGFHECLLRQNKSNEAKLVAPRLSIALARCDVPIEASCLCRLDRQR